MKKFVNSIINMQIFRFIVCAGIYNIIGIIIYWLLLLGNWNYLLANAISALIAIVIAYFLNTKFVFNQKYSWNNFIKFISVYLSNLVISSIGMVVMIEFLAINEFIASPLMIILNVIYNFTLTKFWALRKKD